MNIEKFVKEDMGVRVKKEGEVLLFSLEDISKGLGLINTRDNLLRDDRVKEYTLESYFKCSKIVPPEVVELIPNIFVRDRYVEEEILYLLLMKAKNKKAIEFQVWVATEVLPSIRKNNYYINEKHIDNKQLTDLEEEVKKLKIEKNILHEITYDIANATTMSFTEASLKLFNKDAKYLKEVLIAEGFLGADGNTVLIGEASFLNPKGEKDKFRIFTHTSVQKCRQEDDIVYNKITNFGYMFLKKYFNKKGMSDFSFDKVV